MTLHPRPLDRSGILGHLRTREWWTDIRVRGLLLRVEIGRIMVDVRAGRVYTRGWYARIVGRGATLAKIRAYYARVDEVFGLDGLPGDRAIGTRGYGRTRADAVLFLRRALLNGWMASGALYAPPQFNASYTSEYDL